MKKILKLMITVVLILTLTACDDDTANSDNKEIDNNITTNSNKEENNNNPSNDENSSVLTVDNCPELQLVLYSKNISAMDFAEKYDNCEVEFEATIFKNEKSSITLDRSITVTGELNSEGEGSGYVIKIGNRTWGANIDETVCKGDKVIIEGKVDLDWTEYYKCLYIETESLERKTN